MYETLELERGASDADVRRAYRRLALALHPDKNPGDADAARRFAALSEAYQVLSDPVRRAAYDASGDTAPREGFVPPEDLFRGFFQDMVDSGFHMLDESVLSSLFEGPEVRVAFTALTSFPQGDRAFSRVRDFARGTALEPVLAKLSSTTRSKDIVVTLHVDLQEMYARKLKKVSLRRVRRNDAGEYAVENRPFIVPADDGRVVFRNAADELPDADGVGDVIVRVVPKPHPVFAPLRGGRRGDIMLHKRVAASELLTGCTFWFRHLSGELLKVTSRRPLWNKTVQVLRGEGLPRGRGGPRGNLYVRFQCEDVVSDAHADALWHLLPPVRDDGFLYECDEPYSDAVLDVAADIRLDDLEVRTT